jgi:steroid 5-alpha reductase family enzyme
MLKLIAIAWTISATAMAVLWLWQHRDRSAETISALWPALVGALAIFYATVGDGDSARRSAMGWMMGSWGARLAIQGLYTRAAMFGDADPPRPFWMFQLFAVAAVAASTPALLASLNRNSQLSIVELMACAVWVIGFTGETTADRQRLRFRSKPEHAGIEIQTGLWRYCQSIDRVFEAIIWCAYVTLAIAAFV